MLVRAGLGEGSELWGANTLSAEMRGVDGLMALTVLVEFSEMRESVTDGFLPVEGGFGRGEVDVVNELRLYCLSDLLGRLLEMTDASSLD